MRERSPYEGSLDRSGMMCLARIVSVDSAGRRCRVKTMGTPGVEDLDIPNVRWIQLAWHPEGDEDTFVPRPGCYGIMTFLASEPYILGFFPLDNSSGGNARANQEKLDPGDRIIKTVAGNKIIVRAGGAIQIESTSQCRTYWLPTQNLINTVCQNFELATSGGYFNWLLNKDEETTNLTLRAWDKLTPENALQLEVGTIPIPAEGDPEKAIQINPSDQLIAELSTGPLDPETLKMSQKNLNIRVSYDGTVFLDIGPDKLTLKIDGKTGNVEYITKGAITGTIEKDLTETIKGALTALIEKDATITIKGAMTTAVEKDLTATVKGAANIKSTGAMSVESEAAMNVKSGAAMSVSAGGSYDVKASGAVNIKGDGGANVGSGSAPTNVDGAVVNLAGGGSPVARLGDTAIGIGNLAGPVVSTILQGSPKVTSG